MTLLAGIGLALILLCGILGLSGLLVAIWIKLDRLTRTDRP